MKIDQRLNIVIPVEREGDGEIYVHATPIGREVFERYFLPISKTFTALYSEGLGAIGGPRVAALILKDVATAAGNWDGESGVERGLMNEIRRLTNVISPGPNGWEAVPFHEAQAKGILGSEDTSEVENALVFFTVASWMHRREMRNVTLDGVVNLWGAQIVSSNCTAYAASLKTSTGGETTGAKEIPSSIPS